jgi:hypothetical protein
MMFKYFFACQEDELVTNGKLNLERLGDAAVALRDCNLVKSQCLVTRNGAGDELGAGVILDPLPAGGPLRRAPGLAPDYKWLAIDSGRQGVHAMIGFDPQAKFSPEMIHRHATIDGPPITEGDDDNRREWVIPRTRNAKTQAGGINPFGNLNSHWRPGPTRTWERRLDRSHQWIWDLSCEVKEFLAWYINSDELGPRPNWDSPWYCEATIKVLGINYRLGTAELIALDDIGANPLTSAFAVNVLHAFTAYEEWDAWKAAAGGSKKAAAELEPAGAR